MTSGAKKSVNKSGHFGPGRAAVLMLAELLVRTEGPEGFLVDDVLDQKD